MACYEDVLQWTCDGFDTFGDDFYTCVWSEGLDCDGMYNWAVQYTDEAYWEANEDYEYATWLMEIEPTSDRPVTFSFHFDPEEVNTWMTEQTSKYEVFDQQYREAYTAYVDRVTGIYEQIEAENEEMQARMAGIDAMTEEQLNSTFYDVGKWLEDNFAEETAYLSN